MLCFEGTVIKATGECSKAFALDAGHRKEIHDFFEKHLSSVKTIDLSEADFVELKFFSLLEGLNVSGKTIIVNGLFPKLWYQKIGLLVRWEVKCE